MYILAIVFEIGLVLFLVFWLKKRFDMGWKLFLYSIGLSLAFQMVLFLVLIPIETPIVLLLLSAPVELLVLLLAGTGVLFMLIGTVIDEGGKYLSFRLILKKERSWQKAVVFGAGWSSIGLILLAVNNMILVPELMWLSGLGTEQYINILNQTGMYTESQLLEQWGIVESLSWLDPVLEVVESVSMLIMHISLSVLVMQVFLQKKFLFLPLAMLMHFVVSTSNILSLFYGLEVSYILMLILSVIVGILSFRLAKVNLNELFSKSKRKRQAR
jgi:uncharacterized membrane protein YhfC